MKKYNIGLDIGTSSVGWAVVGENDFKVIRKGNKKLWGVRLFEEANSAEKRRLARGTRRRYDRRRTRLKVLKQEFQKEISVVDPNFFQKMKESFYREDDTRNKTIPILKEEKKLIKKYNKKYPTIYHLRKDVIDKNEKMDIRLIYLAMHHIIKYRGNFLYNSNGFNIQNLNLKEKLEEVFETMQGHCATLNVTDEDYSMLDFEVLEKALLECSKNDKRVQVKEALKNIFPKKFVDEFTKLMVGDIATLNKLFMIETEKDIKISFRGTDFEDKYGEIENDLEEVIEFIELFKETYDMIFLKELFKGHNVSGISELMINKYEAHKKDLKELKELCRNNKKVYHEVFRSKQDKKKEELCLYDKYIRNNISFQDFKKGLEKIFLILSKNETLIPTINQMKEKLEQENFLPRITNSDNGKYPYQLNKEELVKMIENQGKYYPFLCEKTKNGEYKLAKLLSFRIPYYVGPLNNTTSTKEKKNEHAWMIRKEENTLITPYNFEEVVDLDASAEEFILRMIANCTYLLNEKVMPNHSILYSKFKVLNELKQIQVNGIKLKLEIQKQIFEDLFLKESGTITEKKFKDYLRRNKNFSMYDEFKIVGYSAESKFANNMQSYVDFFGENGVFQNTSYQLQDAEDIIQLITIFEDKDIVEKKIRTTYPDLSEKALWKLLNKRYKGWSSLSKKLLTTKYYLEKETNTKKSILDLMEETELNFMQILNEDKFQFQKMIDELNDIQEDSLLNYQNVEKLATSPATKRGIYQALRIVKEITDYMGYNPSNITIEMARSDEKKVRTDDRRKRIEKIYDNFKKDIENYQILSKQLSKQDKIDNEKLFLYFIQEGKSLYSGTPLNIEDLNSYEVDHIIPQTLIKDNSIDNKALVLREENQNKAANYVLPREYRTEYMKHWWEHLKSIGLISSKKFNNLRRSQYTEDDIAGFINRQLVETRQITKHVANILKNFYKDTNIIYLKATLTHNYREKFELFKFREINDFHHAHDAYLAAVLGQYKNTILKQTIDFNRLRELNINLIENKKYKELKYGYVINSLDDSQINYDENGEVIFDIPTFNKTIENTLYQNDILVTKKTEIRTGELFNQTKNKHGKAGVALKKNLPTKFYGSYTRLNPSHAALVRYTKKGKTQQKLIGVPIYIGKDKKNEETLSTYIHNLLSLKETDTFEIIKDKIPFFVKLDWNNQICYLVGASDKVEVINAKQFTVNKENMKKWKYSFERLFNKKEQIIDNIYYNQQLEEIIRYIIEKIEKEYALYQNLVSKMKNMFHYDNLTELTQKEKEDIVIQMLRLLRCDSENANLKCLDASYSMAFGKKNDRIIEHAKIINQSITGIRTHIYEF